MIWGLFYITLCLLLPGNLEITESHYQIILRLDSELAQSDLFYINHRFRGFLWCDALGTKEPRETFDLSRRTNQTC